MTHGFDTEFWERHWGAGHDGRPGSMAASPPNPHLVREAAGLVPGTALDAGCGAGAEALWLAGQGWRVTGVDVSAAALALAAARADARDVSGRVRWIQADLDTWDPGTEFDLVTTHYAHSALPQLELYDRLASWVAPGGSLLVVGHLTTGDHGHGQGHGHGDRPPAEATVTATAVAGRLRDAGWEVVTAEERTRTPDGPEGRAAPLHDVVVRARRA